MKISGMWLPDEFGQLVPMSLDSETGEAKRLASCPEDQRGNSGLRPALSKLQALLERIGLLGRRTQALGVSGRSTAQRTRRERQHSEG